MFPRCLLISLVLALTAAVSLVFSEGPPAAPARPATVSDSPPAVPFGRGGPPVVPGYSQGRRPASSGPAAPVRLYLPNDTAILALQDIRALRASGFLHCDCVRYLSLYNIPPELREDLIRQIWFLTNSLSRNRRIVRAAVVAGSDNTLVRVNMYDYQYKEDIDGRERILGWRRATWEKFAETEPYFHVTLNEDKTQVVTEQVQKQRWVPTGRYYYNGQAEYVLQTYTEQVQRVSDPKRVKVRAHAPWLDAAVISDLARETNSAAPIVRADWFLAVASLPPFYYDFLDIGTKEKDFLDLVFVDDKLRRRAQMDIKGIVVRSGFGVDVIPVARNNRAILRTGTAIGGYLWETEDTDTSVGDFDYLRILLKEKFKFKESIGTGRNGLQFYWLGNDKGDRQDEAPINVAIDRTAVDTRVRNGRSCITCHVKGINDFRPLPQEMLSRAFKLFAIDAKRQYEFEQLYVTNVRDYVAADQVTYARAVAACNDLSVQQNAALFNRFYNFYAEDDITRERVQYEIGLPLKDLMPILELAANQNDPHLLGLLGTEQMPMRRDNFEVSFATLMNLRWLKHQHDHKILHSR